MNYDPMYRTATKVAGIDLSYAAVPVVKPSESWRGMTDAARLQLVKEALQDGPDCVEALSAKSDGHIVLTLITALQAAERGILLMHVEELLKKQVDAGLTVWLEPKGDRNALRRMYRGIDMSKMIEVKPA